MPCRDITETLTITLDHEDRVTHYALTKLTCGGSVGKPSLLRKWIEYRSASDVLRTTPAQALEALPAASTTWEFLTLKHLFAVQSALRVLFGHQPAGLEAACVAETVEHGPKGIRLTAQIKIDLITDEIKACGGCGTRANPAAEPSPSQSAATDLSTQN